MRRAKVKQMNTAYITNLMTGDMSKGEALRKAGYSESSSRVPAKVESTIVHKQAMAELALEAGNLNASVFHELQLRVARGELKDLDIKDFLRSINLVADFYNKIFKEKEAPKQPTQRFNIYNIGKVSKDEPVRVEAEVINNIDK